MRPTRRLFVLAVLFVAANSRDNASACGPRYGSPLGLAMARATGLSAPVGAPRCISFEEDNELLPLYVDVGECVFADAGAYSFEIYFSARDGSDALKGEHPFTVLADEK